MIWYITTYVVSTIAMLIFIIIYAKKNGDTWGDLMKGIIFSVVPIFNTIIFFAILMSVPLATILEKWDRIKDKKVFGEKE